MDRFMKLIRYVEEHWNVKYTKVFFYYAGKYIDDLYLYY